MRRVLRISFVGPEVLWDEPYRVRQSNDAGTELYENTHLVKVDADTANVGRSNGDHSKESVPPSPKH